MAEKDGPMQVVYRVEKMHELTGFRKAQKNWGSTRIGIRIRLASTLHDALGKIRGGENPKLWFVDNFAHCYELLIFAANRIVAFLEV